MFSHHGNNPSRKMQLYPISSKWVELGRKTFSAALDSSPTTKANFASMWAVLRTSKNNVGLSPQPPPNPSDSTSNSKWKDGLSPVIGQHIVSGFEKAHLPLHLAVTWLRKA
jgi:hypothetical protein